ncbi:MAG: CIA30 family protein, partial [Longimicrobiales bacterium]
ATGAAAQTGTQLFRNARVFDGDRVLASTDVLVRAGRIAEIGRGLAAPAGAQVINAAGKTLLPGLIDAHTHAWGDALREALAFGVTSELDMFTDAQLARTLRAEQSAGSGLGRADLFSAGILVTAPGGHGTEYGMTIPTLATPDAAQAFVDARIAEGSDYIKIVYDDGAVYGLKFATLSRATMRAVIAAAHKRGKLAVVHVGSAAGALAALQEGADGLVHLFTNELPTADFAALARTRNVFVVPTLTVLKSVTGEPGAAGLIKDERLAPYMAPATRAGLERAFPARAGTRNYQVAVETVRRLNAAGVPILAGTDAPNPGTAHGVALHRELELLVQAGLSPLQALASATSVPARAFNLRDRGRIAVGLRADLLLVNGDPTTDITTTRAIDGVWKLGVPMDRAAFAAEVKAALTAAAAPLKSVSASLISDFETGSTSARFGTEWMVNTDSYAGGKSTGEQKVTAEGAQQSRGALSITGTVSDALPYAWSGTMWSPGAQPMTPANLSSTRELRFWTRGDGATYRAMVFAQSKGMMPLEQTFVAGPVWREIVIPWSAYGIHAHDLMAVIFAAGPKAGSFQFQVDNISIR